jgi:hypothetical protein
MRSEDMQSTDGRVSKLWKVVGWTLRFVRHEVVECMGERRYGLLSIRTPGLGESEPGYQEGERDVCRGIHVRG